MLQLSLIYRVEEIVMNIDLAPTFLDIAGVPTPAHMDGRSILPLILNRHRNIREQWPDSFLIESSGRRETPEQLAEARARLQNERIQHKLANSTLIGDLNNTATELNQVPKAINVIEQESQEEAEFEESQTEAANVAAEEDEEDDLEDDLDVAEEEDDMDSSLPEEQENEADTDNDDELQQQDQFDNNLPMTPYITKMMRLNSECSNPLLQSNCRYGQKWKCVNENGRWRKHKCKFHVSFQAKLSLS